MCLARGLSLILPGPLLIVVSELVVRLRLGQQVSLTEMSPAALAMICVAAVSSCLVITGLTCRPLFSFACLSIFLCLVTYLHLNKQLALGVPLMPWDLAEWRQIVVLLPALASSWQLISLSLVGMAFISLLVVLWRFSAWTICWRWRLIMIAFGGLYLVLSLHAGRSPIREWLYKRGVANILWDTNANFRYNGFLLPLLLNVGSLQMEPKGYGQHAVEQALLNLPKEVKRGPGGPTDVILYLGEAFWDPTRLGVRFSQDPMPNFRSLAKRGLAGELVSPVYGGGTANAEFELFTGIPASFFPEGTYPYQHYLKRNVEALPSIFQKNGYKTVAIHAFHGWYWMRSTVYPLLGFERFVAREEFPAIINDGPFPSDEPLVDRVLDELNASSGPAFIAAISMVSHGPYMYKPKTDQDIYVLDTMAPRSKLELENYASALYRADRALGRLVKALELRQRETLLIAFGDHLPTLSFAYQDSGYLKNPDNLNHDEKMFHTPVVIWSNQLPKSGEMPIMGMNYLGVVILQQVGIPLPKYFQFLESIMARVPVIRRHLPEEDEKMLGDSGRALRADIESARLLSYDRIIGAGYSFRP